MNVLGILKPILLIFVSISWMERWTKLKLRLQTKPRSANIWFRKSTQQIRRMNRLNWIDNLKPKTSNITSHRFQKRWSNMPLVPGLSESWELQMTLNLQKCWKRMRDGRRSAIPQKRRGTQELSVNEQAMSKSS